MTITLAIFSLLKHREMNSKNTSGQKYQFRCILPPSHIHWQQLGHMSYGTVLHWASVHVHTDVEAQKQLMPKIHSITFLLDLLKWWSSWILEVIYPWERKKNNKKLKKKQGHCFLYKNSWVIELQLKKIASIGQNRHTPLSTSPSEMRWNIVEGIKSWVLQATSMQRIIFLTTTTTVIREKGVKKTEKEGVEKEGLTVV